MSPEVPHLIQAVENQEKWEKENGESDNVDPKQVKVLEEILTLIEDPAKTQYEPLPHYLLNIQ